MLAAPLRLDSNTDFFYLVFDNRVPSSDYTWTSLPIHVVKDADRVIDVRQVVVRASDPTNTGQARVDVIIGNYDFTTTNGAINNVPRPIRLNVGGIGGPGGTGLTQDITLQLFAVNGASGGSAPIIHSVDIGYTVRAAVGVSD
jgi:hypothetical protein